MKKKQVVYDSIEAERAAIFALYSKTDLNKSPIQSELWRNTGENSWAKETLRRDKCEMEAWPARDNILGFACVVNGICFNMPPSSVHTAKRLFDVYADAAMKQRDAQGAIGYGFIGNKVAATAKIKVEMKENTTLEDISARKLPKYLAGKVWDGHNWIEGETDIADLASIGIKV